MQNCPYCGKEYPDDAQVCALDMQPLVRVDSAPPLQPDRMPVSPQESSLSAPWNLKLKADVEFHTSTLETASRTLNPFFQGRGSIEIGPDSLVLSGRQRRFFFWGRTEKVELQLREICNAVRNDRQLQFNFQSSGAELKAGTFSFELETEQEAKQIEALLPQVQTAEFVQVKNFESSLRTATAHVFITPAIILINVLVFIIMAIAGAGLMGADTSDSTPFVTVNPEVHVQWGANFGPLTTDGQPWRLVTSTFLHFGLLHLLFNMWALYAAGQVVERLYGNAFFVIIYLTAGVTGSVASVLWNSKVLSAGASGAIFGVYGASLAYVLLQRKSVPASIGAQFRTSGLIFVAYNLIYGFGHSGIDNAAHLGGLVGGATMGLILARPLDMDARERMALSRCVAGLLVAVVLPIILWFPVRNSGKEYRQEKRFQADLRWFSSEEKSILSDWEVVMKKRQAGSIGDSEVVRVLESAAARWLAAFERLSQAELGAQTPSGRQRALLVKYVDLRRDATKALIEALKTGNRAKLDEFKSLESKVKEVMEEIKVGVKRR